MSNKNPPLPNAVEEVPWTMTIQGKLVVPSGTPTDLIKASVMSQTSFSASLGPSLESIDIVTGAAGLSIVKG